MKSHPSLPLFNRRLTLAMLSTATVAGCTPWENYGFNYLLKVKAEFKGRVLSGEGVMHTGWTWQLLGGLDNLPEYLASSRGEAIALTGEVKTPMYALFVPPLNYPGFRPIYISTVLGAYAGEGLARDVLLAKIAKLRGEYPIPPEHYPALVSFADRGKPETVRIHRQNDVEDQARVTQATVQITDRPVTHYIEKELPWLASLRGNLAGGPVGIVETSSDANRLQRVNFEDRGEI